NPVYFPGDSNLIILAGQAAEKLALDSIIRQERRMVPKIIKGTIVTGDVFVSSLAATQMLRRKMKADATEMEGAAVAQACWQQQVPFIVIRSLSDNAGNNAYDDVKKFYHVAAHNSAKLVVAILGKLAKEQ
ncbi:MAG TPA: 5'-methylthioadenosine/S-adenosylhomocysteine nucleosidase, partial [Segetibacter sp.]